MNENYFQQIIFPPKIIPMDSSKSIIVAKDKGIGSSKLFDFWFLSTTDKATNIIITQLMVACPLCNTGFAIKNKVDNIVVIKYALLTQYEYYRKYIMSHCPNCNKRVKNIHMILNLIQNKDGYRFQDMEDLSYHPLEDATVEEIKEYREYLLCQIKMIGDIL